VRTLEFNTLLFLRTSLTIFFCVALITPSIAFAYPQPSCTAKEVTIVAPGVDPASIKVIDACECASDTALIEYDYSIKANTKRYDIFSGFAVNGQVVYDACLESISTTTGVFSDIDGEADCGDIPGGTHLVEKIQMQLSCDPDGDGNIDPKQSVDLLLGWTAAAGGSGYPATISDPKCSTFGPVEFDMGLVLDLTKVSTDPSGLTSGTDTFNFSSSDTCATTNSITTVTDGVAESATTNMGVIGFDSTTQSYPNGVTIGENLTSAWDLTGISCSSGGTADLAAGTFTIPSAN